MTENESERIPGMYSRETDDPTTMLSSFEGGDAKSYMIGRRVQRLIRIIRIPAVLSVNMKRTVPNTTDGSVIMAHPRICSARRPFDKRYKDLFDN